MTLQRKWAGDSVESRPRPYEVIRMTDARYRDAALTVTTSGEFEVELFQLTEMPSGEMRMAHTFREFLSTLDVAEGIIRDWLGA